MLKTRKMLFFVIIIIATIILTSCYGGTKASGGGVVNFENAGHTAVFGFSVMITDEFDGNYTEGSALLEAKGKFTLVDKAAGLKMTADIQFVEIMESHANTNIIAFFGTTVIDGVEMEVAVWASDSDNDLDPDAIAIMISNGEELFFEDSGSVVHGNINVS